jgi:hypothetical protein
LAHSFAGFRPCRLDPLLWVGQHLVAVPGKAKLPTLYPGCRREDEEGARLPQSLQGHGSIGLGPSLSKVPHLSMAPS